MTDTPLTSADIAERLGAISPAKAHRLLAGAVPISDISMTSEMRTRAAFEDARGSVYSDSDWVEAKSNLVELMIIGDLWRRTPLHD